MQHWCFCPNLPIRGIVLVYITFLLKVSLPIGSDPTRHLTYGVLQQVVQLDFAGMMLIVAAVTCFILALQWGRNTKPWGDKDIIIVSTWLFCPVLKIQTTQSAEV